MDCSVIAPLGGSQHDIEIGHGYEDEHSKTDNNALAARSVENISPGEPFSPSASWSLTPDEASKVMQVLQACEDHDIQRLTNLAATPGGFVEDHIRRQAWPILLGGIKEERQSRKWQDLPSHIDEGQVELDVHRAFVYYPKGESEKQIEGRKRELSELITEVLRRHPDLNYFQGFHDIAQVLLLVLGARDAAPLLARLSLLRIRDFMLPTISATNSQLQLLPAILYAADPVLYKRLSALPPFFALSATLTLYAHDIEEYGGIARLFDFLLAREAVISVYMYATIIMSRKDELFDIEADEPEMFYAILCKLPKPLDLEALIRKTTSLFSEHPPEALPFRAWWRVSSYSVLKTTRNPAAVAAQTLQEGEIYLKKHSDEIERYEARKKMLAQAQVLAHRYRRPASAITLAVFVGALSLWLGKGGQASGVSGIMFGARQRILDLCSYTLSVLRR